MPGRVYQIDAWVDGGAQHRSDRMTPVHYVESDRGISSQHLLVAVSRQPVQRIFEKHCPRGPAWRIFPRNSKWLAAKSAARSRAAGGMIMAAAAIPWLTWHVPGCRTGRPVSGRSWERGLGSVTARSGGRKTARDCQQFCPAGMSRRSSVMNSAQRHAGGDESASGRLDQSTMQSMTQRHLRRAHVRDPADPSVRHWNPLIIPPPVSPLLPKKESRRRPGARTTAPGRHGSRKHM
jgi:hypothetical protein